MLKIQFQDGRAAPILIEAPGKTIGRGDINDIVIDAEGVNGFHADLRVDGNQVLIADVNTATGTFLNDDRLLAPAPLRAGDVITIQGVNLEIFAAEDTVAAKTLVLSGSALLAMGAGGWSLTAESGPEKGQVIPIQELTEIGRALECDISILEPALSRKHAELEVVDGVLCIRDLGSANGTYVNAVKVTEQALKDKDVLQFGKIRFTINAPN